MTKKKSSAPSPHLIVEQLIKGPNNTPVSHLANAQTVIAMDRAWRLKDDDSRLILAWDQFQTSIVMLAPPPWKEHYRGESFTRPRVWDEVDDARAAIWLASSYGIKIGEKTAYSAIITTAQQQQIHPVKEYLLACKKMYLEECAKKPTNRVDRLLADYFGCEHTEYHRDLGRFFMLGAVARIMEPGCKVDMVPIAEGPQGSRKSSSIRSLCPDPEWFYDSDLELGSKDAYQAIRGKWLIELPELDSLSRADEKKIKAFFTSPADTYRPSYGRRFIRVDRQCVFFGTTNQGRDQPYMRDETGGRRFAGFEVGKIDTDKIKADRDLLWGEAVVRYEAGWQWHATGEEALERFQHEQEARYRIDPWEEQFKNWLEGQNPKPNRLKVLEVLGAVFKLDLNQMSDSAQKQAAKALKRAGWMRRRIVAKRGQPPQWFYVPPEWREDDPNAERPSTPVASDSNFSNAPDEREWEI